MLSINDYLDNILIDFESYARSGVKLCDLKSVHWDTVKFLTEDLHTCCIGYDGEHCEGDCERRLGWWPILTCQQAQWQIFEFRKEV